MSDIVTKTLSGIIEIARGMFTVLKHTARPAITLQYPEQRPELNSRFRGRIALTLKSDGSDVCIACKACAKVCPCKDLIYIESAKNENNKPYPEKFTIDIGRCIFCGNCTEICPTNAIIMTNQFELAEYSREALVLDKEKLTLSIEESEKWRNEFDKDR